MSCCSISSCRTSDDEQEQAAARRQVGRTAGEQEPHVEVQAAEVGAHATRPAEPVGVGDVGVEGREDQVDAVRRSGRARRRRSGRPPRDRARAGRRRWSAGRRCASSRAGVASTCCSAASGLPCTKSATSSRTRPTRATATTGGQNARANGRASQADRPRRQQGALQGQRQEGSGSRPAGRLLWPRRAPPVRAAASRVLDEVRQAVGGERPAVGVADDAGDLLGGPARVHADTTRCSSSETWTIWPSCLRSRYVGSRIPEPFTGPSS